MFSSFSLWPRLEASAVGRARKVRRITSRNIIRIANVREANIRDANAI